MFACYTETPQFFNDICDEIRLLFDEKRIEQENSAGQGNLLRHFFVREGNDCVSRSVLYCDGEKAYSAEKRLRLEKNIPALQEKKLVKRAVKQNVYDCLRGHAGKDPPWGSLTGIRPTRLARELFAEMGEARAKRMFRDDFCVAARKADLAFEITNNQKPYLDTVTGDALDVYIGIPFCVSRCKYCSFVSRDVRDGDKAAYLAALRREIEQLAYMAETHDVRSVYVGGGTPTALAPRELDAVLAAAENAFGPVGEFTVEAGRPDTVTGPLLEVIKKHANRISVNIQTANQRTLDAIGRRHTVEEFIEKFGLAREYGFGNMNTDIILGLPGETLEDVRRTLDVVAGLEPESVTVHTLAVKRSSDFAVEQQTRFVRTADIEGMVDLAHTYLRQRRYRPYYLYRQKYMNGNMENTGYARPGFESVYNIDNMEETASVLAFGAGGISKRVFGGAGRIERAANVKNVEQYIGRADEMAERKRVLFR